MIKSSPKDLLDSDFLLDYEVTPPLSHHTLKNSPLYSVYSFLFVCILLYNDATSVVRLYTTTIEPNDLSYQEGPNVDDHHLSLLIYTVKTEDTNL